MNCTMWDHSLGEKLGHRKSRFCVSNHNSIFVHNCRHRIRDEQIVAILTAIPGPANHSIYRWPRRPYLAFPGTAWSFIGLQLALIAIIGAIEPSLRGLAGGLFLLGAAAATVTGLQAVESVAEPRTWQLQTHILIALFAYGLLTVGAIVAVYALIQDRRLHAGKLSTVNQLFAPLETTERLLFGIAGAGFSVLLVAVVLGFTFVDNVFAQHLAHKMFLSVLALLLFGILLAGRRFAGWRGRRAIFLYLWGFAILCLAYFGSRYILEEVLGRHWG
jgi:ABC-type uncharacterized transport system permease subunit